MTKTKAEKMHFRTRCLERLGKVYTQDGLLRELHDGKLDFVERQSNRTTLWRKDNAVFVYDKSRKTFVTALTYDMWMRGRRD
jgi:glucuronate isomerase